MVNLVLFFIVSFVSIQIGYWFCYFVRPKTVGNILINDTEDIDGPFLLLELDGSIKDLSEHDKVIVRVVKQK